MILAIFLAASSAIYCGEIQNIAVSDTNPYLSVDPNESCVAKVIGGLLYGKRVLLKVDNARIRSCRNNVSGVKVTLNNEEVFTIRFKSNNFLFISAKTESFKIDITEALLKLKPTTKSKLKFEPIFAGEDKDGCFSFTARKFTLYLVDRIE